MTAKKKAKGRVGSSFDAFLKSEGRYEETQAIAIKRVLASRTGEGSASGLYVFDEVDAGVSGAIAEVIGRAIADVSRSKQVVCITHLPQIAALADTHFVVGKTEQSGRTESTLRRLGDKERAAEIARMIGGVKVGAAARKAALELLSARHERRA